MSILIRKAQRQDCNKMWCLMKELAIFEHYIDSFAITPEIVEECGFNKNPPDFYCLVATDKENIVGIAVYYFLPYTAQNRPAIYLKELYIDEHYRRQQIGEKLMQALKIEAKNHGCQQIKWTVAPWNESGKHFYEKLGAQQNNEWLNYEWKIN
ncbi:GNAT family N-acetyltransferase [Rodentibacter sp. Ppn85]|uniref:GNAT family N-acetyltransferase n=1 Tax=Rodentibacter sp. Ppn85 TaxID=1908525 RepID=UPI00098616C1|nr:GNAT family N-acetyltransferase [Rodentibacter sp. Ppn85]OOF61867.1 diamine acetyltransferase [Rodentibacter sp. Ppn85]